MEKQCGNFKTMIMYHDSIADKFFQTQTFLAKNITQYLSLHCKHEKSQFQKLGDLVLYCI